MTPTIIIVKFSRQPVPFLRTKNKLPRIKTRETNSNTRTITTIEIIYLYTSYKELFSVVLIHVLSLINIMHKSLFFLEMSNKNFPQ